MRKDRSGPRGAAAACVVVLGLVCLGACAPGGQEIAAQHKHKASNSFGRWVGFAGARVLTFDQITDSTFADRQLIVAPNGAAVVLSFLENAPVGELRYQVAADAGGWWLDVREIADLRVELLDELYEDTWRIRRWRWVLDSSDGTRVESDRLEGLIPALTSRGRLDAVRGAVPREVVAALPFLDAVTRPADTELAAAPPPVRVLARLCGAAEETDAHAELVTEHFRKGLTVRDPEALRFMAGFRSVAAADPLGTFDAERALAMPSTVEGIRRAREDRRQHPLSSPLTKLDREAEWLRVWFGR